MLADKSSLTIAKCKSLPFFSFLDIFMPACTINVSIDYLASHENQMLYTASANNVKFDIFLQNIINTDIIVCAHKLLSIS